MDLGSLIMIFQNTLKYYLMLFTMLYGISKHSIPKASAFLNSPETKIYALQCVSSAEDMKHCSEVLDGVHSWEGVERYE